MLRVLSSAAAGLLLASAAATAETDFQVETLTEDLEHPWAVAFLPGGDILVTERPGSLLRLNAQGGERREVSGVPEVVARNQGGLLDVVPHPDFAKNRWIYLTWAGGENDGNATHLGRGRLNGTELTDFEVLHVTTPFVDSGHHFGSRIVFDGEGHVFFTVGDRGQRDRAQDVNDHNGSVLRVNEDGSIPEDNPFVGRDDAKDAIFSYGHRNAQGAALHPETGRLWIHEHGPRGGDEINLPVAGENFGWPEQTYGREYSGPEIAPDEVEGMAGPIHYWVPSIAPSGMAFYTGDKFPEWQGDLFIGALAMTHIAHLELDGEEVVNEEQLLADRGWRIRDVRQGPDGYLYFVTDAGNGRLARLVPAEG